MASKISPSHILKKTKTGKYRLVKVKTIIPFEYVKEIMSSNSINSRITQSSLIRHIDNQTNSLIKNSDDSFSVIHADIKRLESLLEKVLYISLISILISCIILCIC